MRNIVLAAAILFLAASLAAPFNVSAQSIAYLEAQLQILLNQLTMLRLQLASRQAAESAQFCHTFTSNLGIGVKGPEVHALLTALSIERIVGTDALQSGDDSYFDGSVVVAVKQFQSRYGVIQTGFVGPLTRGKLNQIYGCAEGEARASGVTPSPGVAAVPSVQSVAVVTSTIQTTSTPETQPVPTPTASIFFTSPQGGETYQKGQTYKAAWVWSSGQIDSFSGALSVAGAYLIGEGLGEPGRLIGNVGPVSNAAFPWVVPTDIADGVRYQLRLTIPNSTTTAAMSAPFSVITSSFPLPATSSPVTVFSPLPGSTHNLGDHLIISWGPVQEKISAVKLVSASTTGAVRLYGQIYLGGSKNYMDYVLPVDLQALQPGLYRIALTLSAGGSDVQSGVFTLAPPLPATVALLRSQYSITSVTSFQSAYAAGGMITFSARGAEPDGTPASQTKGFALRTVVTDMENPARTYPTQSVNGIYNTTSDQWNMSMPAPFNTSPTYNLRVILYCANTAATSTCLQKYGSGSQATKDVVFTVTTSTSPLPVQQSALPSISFTSPSAGAKYQKGQMYNISWSTSGVLSGSFNLYLLGGNLTTPRYIGAFAVSTTAFSWMVPTDIPNGNYQFQLGGGQTISGGVSPAFGIVDTQ